jgi:hypothetical protein
VDRLEQRCNTGRTLARLVVDKCAVQAHEGLHGHPYKDDERLRSLLLQILGPWVETVDIEHI